MLVVAKGLYGLGGNIAVLADALRLADKLGWRATADWRDGLYAVDGANVAELLFSHPLLEPLKRDLGGQRVFPQVWSAEIDRTFPKVGLVDGQALSRVTSDMAEDYGLERIADEFDVVVVSRDSRYWYTDELVDYVQTLVPNSEISERVQDLRVGPADIGVHFRHGNGERTVVPPDINWFYGQIDDVLTTNPDARILVCTDASSALAHFSRRYGDRVYSSEKTYPSVGAGGMHFAKSSSERYRSAIEAAVDIWALGRCRFIIGSRSFFTSTATKLAQPLPKSNVRGWMPIHRSHRPAEGHAPVTPETDLGCRLASHGIRLDGLYTATAGPGFDLFYLQWRLADYVSVAELEIDPLKTRLMELRLY